MSWREIHKLCGYTPTIFPGFVKALFFVQTRHPAAVAQRFWSLIFRTGDSSMSESDSDDDAVATELDDGGWKSESEGDAEEGKCLCVLLSVLGFTLFFSNVLADTCVAG